MDKFTLIKQGLEVCKDLDKELDEMIDICYKGLEGRILEPDDHILMTSKALGSLSVKYIMVNAELRRLTEITEELTLPSNRLLKDIIINKSIEAINAGLDTVEKLISENINYATYKIDSIATEQIEHLKDARTVVLYAKDDINKAKSTL